MRWCIAVALFLASLVVDGEPNATQSPQCLARSSLAGASERLSPAAYSRMIEHSLDTQQQQGGETELSVRVLETEVSDIGESLVMVPPCNCTIFAYSHLRKCAGVTVRAMMAGQGPKWKWSGYCVDLRTVRRFWSGELETKARKRRERLAAAGVSAGAAHVPGKMVKFEKHSHWFLEVHCNPELHNFVEGLRDLRAFAAEKGCQLFSAITLRDPVSMLISDFGYFVNEHEKRGLDLAGFARRKPEYLLLGSTKGLGYNHFGLESSEYGAFLTEPSYGVQVPAVREAREALLAAHRSHANLTRARMQANREIRKQMAKPSAEAPGSTEAPGGALTRVQRRARNQVPLDFKSKWWLLHSRSLQATQLARAKLIEALSAHGLFDCERLLAGANALLAEFDLVGFVERMDETTLQLVDALGLQTVPSSLHVNAGGSKRQANADFWAQLGMDYVKATPGEKAALQPSLRALNQCSLRLYHTWLDKFDAKLPTLPASFHQRLRTMRARIDRRPHVAREQAPRSPADGAQDALPGADARATVGGLDARGEGARPVGRVGVPDRSRQVEPRSWKARVGRERLRSGPGPGGRDPGAAPVAADGESRLAALRREAKRASKRRAKLQAPRGGQPELRAVEQDAAPRAGD